MNRSIMMLGKSIDVEVSKRAAFQLEKRTQLLCLEMELYFSCMIRWAGSPSAAIAWMQKSGRKQVRVLDSMNTKLIAPLGNNVVVGFRPVITSACSLEVSDGEPSVSDFPIKKPETYIPKWLKIDFRNNQWCGDFGY